MKKEKVKIDYDLFVDISKFFLLDLDPCYRDDLGEDITGRLLKKVEQMQRNIEYRQTVLARQYDKLGEALDNDPYLPF